VFVEYAKAGPNEMLVCIDTIHRAPAPHLLPTRWCRSNWSWTLGHAKPRSAFDPAKDAFHDRGVADRAQVLRPGRPAPRRRHIAGACGLRGKPA